MEDDTLLAMYNRNIKGPKTVPWGTPDETDTDGEVVPLTKTDCLR